MKLELAHTAICVPDVEAAAEWYASVLGMQVLSPPYLMTGASIEADMRDLIPEPVAVKAAILGNAETDHVIELIEYPNAPAASPRSERDVVATGISHVGLVCDDVDAARAELTAKGAQFVSGVADIAGLRTSWFLDPWGVLFILVEKRKHQDRAYYRQF